MTQQATSLVSDRSRHFRRGLWVEEFTQELTHLSDRPQLLASSCHGLHAWMIDQKQNATRSTSMIAHSVGLIDRATDALVQTRAHAFTIQCFGL